MLALNRRWIEQMIREGRRIIDIGPEFWARRAGRENRPSEIYEMERWMLKGYPHYQKVFVRFGRRGGGSVPGLRIPGRTPEPYRF